MKRHRISRMIDRLCSLAGRERGLTSVETLESRTLLSLDLGLADATISSPVGGGFDNWGYAIASADDPLANFSFVVASARDANIGAGAVYEIVGSSTVPFVNSALGVIPAPGDEFGVALSADTSVAPGVDGRLVVAVGARGDDERGSNAGAVYLFSALYSGGVLGQWSFAKVFAPDPTPNDRFGQSVDVVGSTLVVGAPNARPDGVTGAGKAYVFPLTFDWDGRVSAGAGIQLLAPSPSSGDLFGWSVAVGSSGVFVGAHLDDDDRGIDVGSVFYFDANGTLLRRYSAPNSQAGDRFGTAIAYSTGKLSVGSPLHDSGGLVDSGAVYVIDTASEQVVNSLAGGPLSLGFGRSIDMVDGVLAIGANAGGSKILREVGGTYSPWRSAPSNARSIAWTSHSLISSENAVSAIAVWGRTASTPHLISMTAINPDGSVGDAFTESGAGGTRAIVSEGGTPALLRFERNGSINRPLRAHVTLFGNANQGTDFSGNPLGEGYVDFAIDEASVTKSFSAVFGQNFENLRARERLTFVLDTDPLTPGSQGNPTGDLAGDPVSGWSVRTGGTGPEPFYRVDLSRAMARIEIAEQTAVQPFWIVPSGSVDPIWEVDADGARVIAGRPDLSNQRGIAYVFSSTTGGTMHTLGATQPTDGARFGTSVALSGQYAVVGEPYREVNSQSAGRVHIFNLATGQQWAIPEPAGAGPGSFGQFGLSVAADGDFAVVGGLTGRAYLFRLSTREHVGTFNPIVPTDQALGYKVAISGDIIALTASTPQNRTSVSMFRASTQQPISRYAFPSAGPADEMGFALDVAVDGQRVVLSIGNNDGSGYVSTKVVSIDALTGARLLTFSPPPRPSNGSPYVRPFGESLDSHDGVVAIGMPPFFELGSVELYNLESGTWTGSVVSGQGSMHPRGFGHSVAFSTGTIAAAEDGSGIPGVRFIGTSEFRADIIDPSTGIPSTAPLFADSFNNVRTGVKTAAREGQTVSFRFTRIGDNSREQTLYFHYTGTANPADHDANPNTLFSVTFAPGETTKDVDINLLRGEPVADDLLFLPETLTLNLDADQLRGGLQGVPVGTLVWEDGVLVPAPGTAGVDPFSIITPDRWQAQVDIIDMDGSFAKIGSTNATGGEGDTVSFTVVRHGDPTPALDVPVEMSGTALGSFGSAGVGVDYLLTAGDGATILSFNGSLLWMRIAAGAPQATINIVMLSDGEPENHIEWVHAELLPPTNGSPYALTGIRSEQFVRMGFTDRDKQAVLLTPDTANLRATEGGGRARFTLNRSTYFASTAIGSPLTLQLRFDQSRSTATIGDFRLEDAGEVAFHRIGDTYSIPFDGGVATREVFVRAFNDPDAEADERAVFELIGSGYATNPSQAGIEVLVADNDRSMVSIVALDPFASENNRDPGVFRLARDPGSAGSRIEVWLALTESPFGLATASWRADYEFFVGGAALNTNRVTMDAGVAVVDVTLVPRQDRFGELQERVNLTILPSVGYDPAPGVASAIIFIDDETYGAGLRAIWDWSMVSRYGRDDNGDGRIDIRNTFDWTNPAGGYEVVLDGSATTPRNSALTFTWTIRDQSGAVFGTPITVSGVSDSERRVTTRLPEGTYFVTLDVSDGLGRASRDQQFVDVDDILIVSAGDSYASGEGAPDVDFPAPAGLGWLMPYLTFPFSNPNLATWADDGVNAGGGIGTVEYDHAAAHRSAFAASSLTALAMEAADPKSSVTFVFVAQSGAQITKGFLEPMQEGADGKFPNGFPKSQLDMIRDLVGPREIDALMLSFGGNDIKFSEIAAEYLFRVKLRLLPFIGPEVPITSLDAIRDTIGRNLAVLPERYADLAREVNLLNIRRDTDQNQQVIIQAYPDSVGGNDGNPTSFFEDAIPSSLMGTVGGFLLGPIVNIISSWFADLPLRIDAEEAAHARTYALGPLNAAVETASRQHGWTYVPASDAFRFHGYASSQPWFRTASESRRLQGGGMLKPMGALHPNRAGYEVLRDGQLATFLGSARPTISFSPGLSQVTLPEDGSVQLSVVTSGADSSIEWDLNFDGTRFAPTPGVTGTAATISAHGRYFPNAFRVAARITDRLGRSSFTMVDVVLANANDGRRVFDSQSANIGQPFYLGLERNRVGDPVAYWTVDWGDGSQSTVPGDWKGISKIYGERGRRTINVWLTDAGGTFQTASQEVFVYSDEPIPAVSAAFRVSTTAERGPTPLLVRFQRATQFSGQPLQVAFTLSGSAVNGSDYVLFDTGRPLPTSIIFPTGSNAVEFMILPLADDAFEPTPESITISIRASALYRVATGPITATIEDGPPASAGSVTGRLFDDANGSGTFDLGESPRFGWSSVLDLNRNGVVDPGEPIATSDTNGLYRHEFVLPGPTAILFLPPAGWLSTTTPSRSFTVFPRGVVSGVDFGAALPVSISGVVFRDDDIDGIRQASAEPRVGARVFVDVDADGLLDADELLLSAVSDSSGAFSIGGARPGRILLRVDTEEAWTTTNADAAGAILLTPLGGTNVSAVEIGQRRRPPRVGSLDIFGPDVVTSGSNVTFSISNVDPWATAVELYRESNGIAGLQIGAGGDTLLSRDFSGFDGWSTHLQLSFDPGEYRFYAFAVDPAVVPDPTIAAVSRTITVVGTPSPTTVFVFAEPQTLREGSSLSAVITVSRVGRNADDTIVRLSSVVEAGWTTPGLDHPEIPASVVIPAGQSSVTILVPIFADAIDEGIEPFGVRILPDAAYTIGQEAAVLIVEDMFSTPPVLTVRSANATSNASENRVHLRLSADITPSISRVQVTVLDADSLLPVPVEVRSSFDPVLGLLQVALRRTVDGNSFSLPGGRYIFVLSASGLESAEGFGLDGDRDGVAGDDFRFETIVTGNSQWRSGASGDWHEPSNWMDLRVPKQLDVVTIFSGSPVISQHVVVLALFSYDSIVIRSSGSLKTTNLYLSQSSTVRAETAVSAVGPAIEAESAFIGGRLEIHLDWGSSQPSSGRIRIIEFESSAVGSFASIVVSSSRPESSQAVRATSASVDLHFSPGWSVRGKRAQPFLFFAEDDQFALPEPR